VERYLIRRRDICFPERRWLYEPQVGVFTLCGAASNRGPPLSSPRCWSCRCMDGFLIPGWDLIFPGWRWLTETKVVITTQCGPASPLGTTVFVPRVIGARDVWKDFWSGDLIHGSHIGVSTPCEAVLPRGKAMLLELYLYGRWKELWSKDETLIYFHARVALAPRTSGWGFHTAGDRFDLGDRPLSIAQGVLP